MELALALSLVEMKDRQLSAPSQESQLRPLPPGGRQNESGWVGPTSVSQTPSRGQTCSADAARTTGPGAGLWAKVCAVEADACTEDEPVSCTSGNPTTEVGGSHQPEKPKQAKKRRARRRCAGQQVVGVPRAPAAAAAAPVLLWFRRDLRLCDNPALIAALELGAPLIPLFIWSPEEEEGPSLTVAMGGACKPDSRNWCCS